jgi:DNA replication protein DnaC
MWTMAKKTSAEKDRERLLDCFGSLCIPMRSEQLDEALARAEKEGMSYLEFLELLIGEQANGRRQRRVERRIREACFDEVTTMDSFDWDFNARTIDRVQMQTLSSGQFIDRRENLVMVGQSGLGKSHLIQAIGRQACTMEYRVRYTTSAKLLSDLTACLADRTLPSRMRYYTRFDLLIIDEFGLDHIERQESRQAANLLYKVIDGRSQKRSTALVTNIDFKAWSDYLGDAPLATALLDRLVDRAIILKLKGRSYRAARAKGAPSTELEDATPQ